MLTPRQKLCVTIVRQMHICAGRILDLADVLESRIKLPE